MFQGSYELIAKNHSKLKMKSNGLKLDADNGSDATGHFTAPFMEVRENMLPRYRTW
jgi:hypothetical protein